MIVLFLMMFSLKISCMEKSDNPQFFYQHSQKVIPKIPMMATCSQREEKKHKNDT